MSETAHKIVEAGEASADRKLAGNASLQSNPAAMAEKVLKEGARTLTSQAAKGQETPQTASLATVRAAVFHDQPVLVSFQDAYHPLPSLPPDSRLTNTVGVPFKQCVSDEKR